jgi:hypothetical protein
VIGIPWWYAAVLLLGVILFFGWMAFMALTALRLPTRQEQAGPTTAADRPTEAGRRADTAPSKIFIAAVLGFVWLFVWIIVLNALDYFYGGRIPFNPADPWPLVRISFIISASALCVVILVTRLIIWMRKRRS